MARRRTIKATLESTLTKILEYIEWLDHHANGSWQDKIDHTPAICQSWGVPVKEDKRAVTIAGSFSPGPDHFGNTQYILKNCIVRRHKLDTSRIVK